VTAQNSQQGVLFRNVEKSGVIDPQVHPPLLESL